MEKKKTSKLRKGSTERPRTAAPKSNVQDPHAKKSKRRNDVATTQNARAGKSTQSTSIPNGSNRSQYHTEKVETYPHFRWYRKSNHPALIVGEHTLDEYKYRKVMHNQRDGKRLNEEISPNPNPKDLQPMYISKRVRHDKKRFFGIRLSWKYKKEDKKK